MISLDLLCRAKDYYEKKGYTPIDVPHVIDRKYSEHTKPEGISDLHHTGDKVYCASAEQSFIQMIEEGQLSEGRYQALTPCYRPERFLSDQSYLVFLKLELISVGKSEQWRLLADAHIVMSWLGVNTDFVGDWGGEQDLEDKDGLELGSYGVRKSPSGIVYTYGTGLALPRFSNSLREVDNGL